MVFEFGFQTTSCDMSHIIWIIQIPAWMFTWRIFWAFRRFWIDLLGIEPARWLLELPSGWKQVNWGHFRSFTYSCNSSDFFKSFQIRFLFPSDREIQDHWIRLVNLGRNFRIIFLRFLVERQWGHQIWHNLRIRLLFWMFYFNFRAELDKLGTFRDPWTGSELHWLLTLRPVRTIPDNKWVSPVWGIDTK